MKYVLKLVPMILLLLVVSSCQTKNKMLTFHDTGKAAAEPVLDKNGKPIPVVVVPPAKLEDNPAVKAIIKELEDLRDDVNKTVEVKQAERLKLIKKLEQTKEFVEQVQADLQAATEEKENIEFFKPKLAVNIRYFKDMGKDDPGEIDVFSDGRSLIALSGVIDIIRIRKMGIPWTDITLPMEWGWNMGLGVGAANIVENGENKTAAALLVTTGIFLDFYRKNHSQYIGGFELGYAYGYTFEESFSDDDNDDTAWYFGYTYKFTF